MKKNIFTSIIATGLFISSTVSHAVVVNGLEWMQLTDINSNSYTSYDSVFDANGEGTGSLGGIDFVGWTWASQSKVNDLFSSYFGTPFDGFENGVGLSEADAYFNDFNAMGSNSSANWNYAWTLDQKVVEVTDRFTSTDYFNTNHSASSNVNSEFSAYVYRNVAVPEPTSLALLGLGLAGFGFSRKKKKA